MPGINSQHELKCQESYLCADWLNSLLLDLVAEFTANNLAVGSVGEPVQNRNRRLVMRALNVAVLDTTYFFAFFG